MLATRQWPHCHSASLVDHAVTRWDNSIAEPADFEIDMPRLRSHRIARRGRGVACRIECAGGPGRQWRLLRGPAAGGNSRVGA
jgi:hypothetical protein